MMLVGDLNTPLKNRNGYWIGESGIASMEGKVPWAKLQALIEF